MRRRRRRHGRIVWAARRRRTRRRRNGRTWCCGTDGDRDLARCSSNHGRVARKRRDWPRFASVEDSRPRTASDDADRRRLPSAWRLGPCDPCVVACYAEGRFWVGWPLSGGLGDVFDVIE